MHCSRMHTIRSSSCWGAASVHAEIHPPGCGPGDPPGDPPGVGLETPLVWAWRPPWVWAWRPPGVGLEIPLGVGLEIPLGVGLETPRPDPSTSPWVWAWKPARHAGIPPLYCKTCWDTPPPPNGQNS